MPHDRYQRQRKISGQKNKSVIEIFKTNIQQQSQAEAVGRVLAGIFPDCRINFDIDDRDKILRMEGSFVDVRAVISAVEDLGFSCKAIPDRICEETANPPEEMRAFWETGFLEHKTMWGFEPARSAIIARDAFVEEGIRDVLVPGIGYGRNARVFIDSGIKVTGIEISAAAIELAREHYGTDMDIFHGSVTDMPFDAHLYEGIFCYGLVYLLDPDQRKKMISDCYHQLKPGGRMIFSVVSKNSPNYGKGREVRKDTFEVARGGQVFFYDTDAVKQDFGGYGLEDFFEIEEPNNAAGNRPSFRFIVIKCKKGNSIADNNLEAISPRGDE